MCSSRSPRTERSTVTSDCSTTMVRESLASTHDMRRMSPTLRAATVAPPLPSVTLVAPGPSTPASAEKAERHGGRTATSALGQRCARAASLGHVDTLRELRHCLWKGYGVRCSMLDGRRLLIQTNAREIAPRSPRRPRSSAPPASWLPPARHSCLFCDFGCHAAAKAPSCSPVATRGEETGMRRGGEGRGIRG
uniref:Uncharacterized protein n=1 Tax=Oryza nivara TaxID=4536 RepID=A0A0E0I9D4_ORYNI